MTRIWKRDQLRLGVDYVVRWKVRSGVVVNGLMQPRMPGFQEIVPGWLARRYAGTGTVDVIGTVADVETIA